MTLKEKFREVEFNINDLETIADDFAIGFAEWLLRYNKEWPTVKELLENYKKEKGL